MTGHVCPECGTDTGPGADPAAGAGCDCARQAAPRDTERERAERSAAEIAAAEDFDPLRIRPYVTLGDDPATAGSEGGSEEPDPWPAREGATTTMPLFLDAAAVQPPVTTERATNPPVPVGGGEGAAAPPTVVLAPGVDPVQPRRRKPYAALVAGAAVVAVVGTAAFVGGLFGSENSGDMERDEALPSVVASLPDADVAPSPSHSTSAAPSRSASAAPPASTAPRPSASASTSGSLAPSASATPSATASPPAVTASPTGPASAAPPPQSLAGPSLRRGDQGAEVSELQRRLQELWLYRGPDDGDYSGKVEDAVRVYQSYKAIKDDPAGTYGPQTRQALEAETTGRGRR